MPDQGQINLSISTQPSVGLAGSGLANVIVPLCEAFQLGAKVVTELDLSSDAPVAVPFIQLTGANIAYFKLFVGQGFPVTLTLTSAQGTTQTIPFDDVFFVVSGSSPYTAISLTRTAGVDQQVEVFIGQYPS